MPVAAPTDSAPELAAMLNEVEVRRIVYRSGGLKIHGYMAWPRNASGRLPCVIHNRGGNWKLNVWTDDAAIQTLGRFASWGYLTVATQYRGAGGSEGRDEYGGADVDDVLNLLPVLESEPRADPARIGMVGASRGGMMTYLALAKTHRIAAAVVNSGLADLAQLRSERPEMERVWLEAIPGYQADRNLVLKARSMVSWPDRLSKTTPILVLHGTADWRCPPKSNAIDAAAALLQARQPFRLVLFEGGQHGLAEHREEMVRLMRDWLDRYVRDRKPWPSLEPHGN